MLNLQTSSNWVARQWNTLPQHMPIQRHDDIQVKVESSCRTHFIVVHITTIQWISLERKWFDNASLYRLSVTRHPGHYDFLNDVAFGHKELWQTLVADSLSNVMAYGHHKLWWSLSMNSLSVNFQMLLSLATMNCGGPMTQIAFLWTLKCCCLRPQWTVVAEWHK